MGKEILMFGDIEIKKNILVTCVLIIKLSH